MAHVCPEAVHEKMKDHDATWRSLRFGYVEAFLGDDGRYEWFETRHCHCGSSIMRATVSRNTWRLWDPRKPWQIISANSNGAMTMTLAEYNALRSKRYRYQTGRIVEVSR